MISYEMSIRCYSQNTGDRALTISQIHGSVDLKNADPDTEKIYLLAENLRRRHIYLYVLSAPISPLPRLIMSVASNAKNTNGCKVNLELD